MTDLTTLLRPQATGKTVNSHVVQWVSEPKPDFAAMNRAIQGSQTAKTEQREGKNERVVLERAKG